MMVGTKGLVIGPHSTVYMPARSMPASPIGDARRAGRSGGQLVIGMVLVSLWAVLVAGVVAMVRAARATPAPAALGPVQSPVHLLDERFARGEIDEADYLNRRDVLSSFLTPGPRVIAR